MVGAGVAHRREAGLAIVGRAVHRDHGRCGSNRVTVPVGLHAAPWTRSLFWAPSGGPPAPSLGPVGVVSLELSKGWWSGGGGLSPRCGVVPLPSGRLLTLCGRDWMAPVGAGVV